MIERSLLHLLKSLVKEYGEARRDLTQIKEEKERAAREQFDLEREARLRIHANDLELQRMKTTMAWLERRDHLAACAYFNQQIYRLNEQLALLDNQMADVEEGMELVVEDQKSGRSVKASVTDSYSQSSSPILSIDEEGATSSKELSSSADLTLAQYSTEKSALINGRQRMKSPRKIHRADARPPIAVNASSNKSLDPSAHNDGKTGANTLFIPRTVNEVFNYVIRRA